MSEERSYNGIVEASEISAKIRKGEDVEYDGFIIKGGLDITPADDPDVEYELYVVKGRLHVIPNDDGVPVISSKISITNSRFDGDVRFFKIVFEKKINFSDTIFMGIARFGGAQFKGDAIFEGVQFNEYTSFFATIFNKNAYFSETHFSGVADFRSAYFGDAVHFRDSQFRNDVRFSYAKFKVNTNFFKAQFNSNTDFDYAQLYGNTFICDVTFDGRANFEFAKFDKNYAVFSGTQFKGDAPTFKNAIFFSPYSKAEACRKVKTILKGAGDREDAGELSGANLSEIDLSEASVKRANLSETNFSGANFSGANLSGINLSKANFSGANLSETNLSETNLSEANFSGANLSGTNLSKADLRDANLSKASLRDANLSKADLSMAILVETNLERADLTGCNIYGISAWELKLNGAQQNGLVITPSNKPTITVDNLEVAQFIYLLLHNEKIRDVIDTIARKAVLILGRFTPERMAVLEALRVELRDRGYLPILFDFDKPTTRDFTETIRILAGMSLFVIADISNPKSSPLELQATIPEYMVPFVPIIQKGEEPFSMFKDLYIKYKKWVLEPLEYDTLEDLIKALDEDVINPALTMHDQLQAEKATEMPRRCIGDGREKKLDS